MFDGVYVAHPDSGQPTFVAVPPTSDAQVQRLIEQVAVRLIQQLQRRGVLDDTHADGLAYGRRRQRDRGDVAFALKGPWTSVRPHLVFEPLAYIGRLAALTPPARRRLIRYHGVLARDAALSHATLLPRAAAEPR